MKGTSRYRVTGESSEQKAMMHEDVEWRSATMADVEVVFVGGTKGQQRKLLCNCESEEVEVRWVKGLETRLASCVTASASSRRFASGRSRATASPMTRLQSPMCRLMRTERGAKLSLGGRGSHLSDLLAGRLVRGPRVSLAFA